jgi:hypothetical protein
MNKGKAEKRIGVFLEHGIGHGVFGRGRRVAKMKKELVAKSRFAFQRFLQTRNTDRI